MRTARPDLLGGDDWASRDAIGGRDATLLGGATGSASIWSILRGGSRDIRLGVSLGLCEVRATGYVLKSITLSEIRECGSHKLRSTVSGHHLRDAPPGEYVLHLVHH